MELFFHVTDYLIHAHTFLKWIALQKPILLGCKLYTDMTGSCLGARKGLYSPEVWPTWRWMLCPCSSICFVIFSIAKCFEYFYLDRIFLSPVALELYWNLDIRGPKCRIGRKRVNHRSVWLAKQTHWLILWAFTFDILIPAVIWPFSHSLLSKKCYICVKCPALFCFYWLLGKVACSGLGNSDNRFHYSVLTVPWLIVHSSLKVLKLICQHYYFLFLKFKYATLSSYIFTSIIPIKNNFPIKHWV